MTKRVIKTAAAALLGAVLSTALWAQDGSLRPRDYGIEIGVLHPGANNAITDVKGVLVGQVDIHDAKRGAQTGVTAVLPHGGNIFKEKVPAEDFPRQCLRQARGLPAGEGAWQH